MSDWPVVALGDHADLMVGYAFKSAQFLDTPADAVRLLRGDNVAQGTLRWEGAKYWPKADHSLVERFALREGDVILAMDRPWIDAGLKYAYVRKSDLPCALVQRVARLRGTPTLDIGYLRALIGSQLFTGHVQSITTGVNIPHISGKDIKRFEFPLPPIDEQRRIASILGAYDDLVEVNRRRVALLEGMARGLFEEWFVRFRFPGHEAVPMTDTPDGPLPEGWVTGTLGSLVELRNDKVLPGPHLADRSYVPIECIGKRTLMLADERPWEEAKSSLQLFERDDILFGAMRAYFHKVAPAPMAGITRSTCFVLRSRRPELWAYSLLSLFRDETIAYATTHSRGSTIPYAFWKGGLERLPCPIPDGELLARFEMCVRPVIEQVMASYRAIQLLAASRDLLLPRLISGQLSVTAAERELEDAA